jgi:cell division protein FtsN
MSKDYAKRFDRTESKPKPRRLLRVIGVIIVVLIFILCFRFWQLQRHRTIVLTPDKTPPHAATVATPAAQQKIESNLDQKKKIHFEFYTMLSKNEKVSNQPTSSDTEHNKKPLLDSTQEGSSPLASVSTKTVSVESPPVESQVLIEKMTAKSVFKEAYVVQIGVFSNARTAETSKNQMSNLAVPIQIVKNQVKGKTIYRVEAGPFETIEEAHQLQHKLAKSKVQSMVRKKD